MRVDRFDDVHAFLRVAGAFLEAREAEHNLLLGIAGTLRDRPEAFDEPAQLFVARDGTAGEGDDAPVMAVVIRTPPWPLVLSQTESVGAIDALATAMLARDPEARRMVGPAVDIRRFVEVVERATGRPAWLQTRERAFRLERVRPPLPTQGSWRVATPDDLPVLERWLPAFHDEAVPEDPPIQDVAGFAARWLGDARRTAYLWIVDGEPVSLVGAGNPTPHGIRVGPVYTPPAHRDRGYASALTAAASQDQLDRGRRFCFLFTDLANPTSNKIYRAIGYEPVADVDLWSFEPAPSG